ncbi:helix-turn-helix domain-containing protein [Arsenicicoccus dermatophilus]|uniref:helix-turn-helix domain-containing protein n=1 Tax=Arsenicicoccus dermatophilus TaxID=1076331 RepID=UPI001F4CF161|nr:helix-turn-helix transcriptional regulator [Arsenicicoccus dermatophilus]MCH8612786.1 helix-turn-helix transcriptional regulator [Arsenicicoccus dermatophilus]
MTTPTPRPVLRALDRLGGSLRGWRTLQGLTIEQVAERAGVSTSTVKRIESGQGAALEATLRVARALGVLDDLVASVDPLGSDVGRLRAEELLPTRGRRRASAS